jgi:hypothetical protein
MRWVGHVACTGQKKNAHEGLVGKCEGKRPLRRPRHKWEDDIKIHFKETGRKNMNSIDLPQDRVQCQAVVDTVMNMNFHKMRDVSSVAEKLLVCQDLQSMDLLKDVLNC